MRYVEGTVALLVCVIVAIPIAVIRGIRWGLQDAWRELVR